MVFLREGMSLSLSVDTIDGGYEGLWIKGTPFFMFDLCVKEKYKSN